MVIGLVVMTFAAIAFSAWRLQVQDRIIGDLQDRLMARNYTEYAAYLPRVERPPEEPEYKPKSWYDDGVGDNE